MKNVLKYLVITALVPTAVFAQGSLDEEVNAELDRMYGQQKAASTSASQAGTQNATSANNVQVTVSQAPVQTQSAGQAATQATVVQQAQKQPTTVIEAAPLAESGAEKLRKNRQDAELSTELTIVEKLEQSRLEDEKKRAEILFGDKFNALSNKEQKAEVKAETQQAVVPVVVPEQVVIAPAPVENKEDTKEMIKGEVSAALAELKSKEDEKPKSSGYFGAMVGAGDYPDAVNIRGQYSLGVAYGKKFDDRLVVEGSFLYSNYQVEQRDGGCVIDGFGNTTCFPRITEMNQYSTGGLVKYQLLGGMLRPEIGTLLTYTYRTYADTQFGLSDDSVASHALDMGLMTGASLELSQQFSLGVDFRYMWNLTNKVDSGFQKSYVQPYLNSDKPVERLNYYTLSISGKASF